MKQAIWALALATLTVGCAGGGDKKEEKKGFEVKRTRTEEKGSNERAAVPVDLDNKGIGPITNLVLDEAISQEMATSGEAKFNQLCTSCHMEEERMIGPAMAGVLERRSPEWVMNMILNPTEMLQEDPIAKALLEEYNGSLMLNQNLSQEEARDILEYLRTL